MSKDILWCLYKVIKSGGGAVVLTKPNRRYKMSKAMLQRAVNILGEMSQELIDMGYEPTTLQHLIKTHPIVGIATERFSVKANAILRRAYDCVDDYDPKIAMEIIGAKVLYVGDLEDLREECLMVGSDQSRSSVAGNAKPS